MNKRYFYCKVCTSIFESMGLTNNPILKDVSYDNLLDFRDIVIKLPKKTLTKYRYLELGQIIKILDEITNLERLSEITVNKYIKWLRTLYNFSLVRGLVDINLAQAIPTVKTTDDKLQRLPLNNKECALIVNSLTNGRYRSLEVSKEKKYLFLVLKYTGMRLSELYKCTLDILDGITCFNLTDRSIKLKTKSSYRIIPLHSSLLKEIENFYDYRDKITPINLSESVNKIIKRLKFKDYTKKSLYSLRHLFATELIQTGANPTIVSELMGHSHSTMTLSRYSTGFSVKQLKAVIELL